MRIAIIGAGAIGSVAAAYLTKAGQDVILVGKAEQVFTINKSGLHVKGVWGDQTIKVAAQTKLDHDPDLVIFTIKTQDLAEACQHNKEFLNHCFVLSSQNGVQADSILGSHFEKEKMLSSIVMFGATYVKPGDVTFNFEGDWIVGRPYSPVDSKTHAVAEVLKSAFPVVISANITGMKYLKLFVNFNNCIPALIGKSMQETFADMDLCRLSILLLKEGVDVIKKANIDMISLPQFPVERIYGLVNMPGEQAAAIMNKTLTGLSREPLYGSILQSIMRGKTSEIDFINGEIVHLAKQMRLSSPFNERMVAMVHEVERRGRFFELEDVKKEFELGAQHAVPVRNILEE